MANGKVAARLGEMQQLAQQKYEVTQDTQIARYIQLLEDTQNYVDDPKAKIDLKIKVLSRLDKIAGLENPQPGDQTMFVVNLEGRDALV